jgi:tRNA(adenine34) deaminase
MCAGALFWCRIDELIYGASDEKRGYTQVAKHNALHPKTTVRHGVLIDECGRLMTEFFRRKR